MGARFDATTAPENPLFSGVRVRRVCLYGPTTTTDPKRIYEPQMPMIPVSTSPHDDIPDVRRIPLVQNIGCPNHFFGPDEVGS